MSKKILPILFSTVLIFCCTKVLSGGMDRKDHIEWLKKRGIEYCKRGDLISAKSSILNDLGKHEETKNLKEFAFLHMMYIKNINELIQFIKGFN